MSELEAKPITKRVDKIITEVDRHVPWLIKQASSQARDVATNIQRAGVVETSKNMAKTLYAKYEPAAKEYYYIKYEPLAEQYAVQTWTTVNRLPLVSQAAHMLVPTAAYLSEKYRLSFYMPLIPLEKIAKVFAGAGNGLTASTNGESDALVQ